MNHAKDNASKAEAHIDNTSELHYAKPETEQAFRADLEEVWQGESPGTARDTDIADEVDGRLGTRKRTPDNA